ncbi:hypothetical protein SAMN05216570_3389 [Dyella sp. OK004]|uniref:XVIPCD domain-containing protein n=1 Tax=Dyella sp. OK004 TaxID=1855292 RepID=UPI0008F25581|nr:XVIPCD domain-containing protein [Dyella sp. OK004]SFS16818.1 hypothetical protein SAMN05216570_3389 [Dyella sp. OK004]
MTITRKDYALLDKDSYVPHEKDDSVIFGGVGYTIFDTYSDPITGYHGTAYRRTDTHEIVIAHRGTEKSWGVIQDGPTDLGMVVTGFNAQLPDARAFTKRVMENAEAFAANKHVAIPPITTTGHSLGGTLAQITAYENHLQGVTFNAYGAVDLQHDIPEGGSRVTNYVRATDVVSAASRHYGTVHVLATAQDVHDLSHAGYDDRVTATSLRNPLSAISVAAHSIDNFAPDSPGLASSDLSPENEVRARLNAQAIGLYRADVQALRSNTLSHAWEMAHKAGTARELLTSASRSVMHGEFAQAGHALDMAGHRTVENLAHQRDTVINTAKLAGYAVEEMGHQAAHSVSDVYDATRDGMTQGVQMLKQQTHLVTEVMSDGMSRAAGTLSHPGQWFESRSATPDAPALLNHPTHPGHAMFQQGLHGVQRLNAKHGVAPSERDANFAGALASAAAEQGLTRIDHVVLSDDASRAFAVQGRLHGGIAGLDQKYVYVETVTALHTPLAQSSAQWELVMQQNQADLTYSQTEQVARQQISPQESRHVERSM